MVEESSDKDVEGKELSEGTDGGWSLEGEPSEVNSVQSLDANGSRKENNQIVSGLQQKRYPSFEKLFKKRDQNAILRWTHVEKGLTVVSTRNNIRLKIAITGLEGTWCRLANEFLVNFRGSRDMRTGIKGT